MECIKDALRQFKLDVESMVAFCSDGAAVNMGCRSGVATLLKQDAPWLIVMHCLNHVLEFAVKDAFKNTDVEMVVEMLNVVYGMYHRSAKRWSDLQKVIRQNKSIIFKFHIKQLF